MKKAGILIVLIFLFSAGCDTSIEKLDPSARILLINQGTLTMAPGESQQLTASLVGVDGTVDVTAKVQWSVDSDGASFSGNTLSISGNSGSFFVKASASIDGYNFTAQVPGSIVLPDGLLIVAPAGILVFQGEEPMDLSVLYLGKTKPSSYVYSSNNPSVATVSNTGKVSFSAPGECVLTVKTIGLTPQQSIDIPVLVLGQLDAKFGVLPITKVTLTPSSKMIFVGTSIQLQAKAFNAKGEETNPEGGFTWVLESVDEDPEDGENPPVGTISPSGNTCTFNASGRIGRAQITASTAAGIVGQAEIFTSPEFVMFVDPPIISLTSGSVKQFALETYKVDDQTWSISTNKVVNPADVNWLFLNAGIPEFNIGNVDNAGKVTIKGDATPGMIGTLLAFSPNPKYAPGVSIITVAFGEPCNCGTQNAAAVDIDVVTTTVNLSLFGGGSVTRPATIVNATGQPVAGAKAIYCSDNEQVATVDESGFIVGALPGTATITVCHGTLKKSITVNVTL